MAKNEKPLILAGDVGGTKTNLALYHLKNGTPKSIALASYASPKYKGLEPIIAEFIKKHPHQVTHAAFGVAGPILDGQSKTTNLPWIVRARSIETMLHLPCVGLINDLVANAWGVAALRSSDVSVLNKGSHHAGGNKALLSAGTGLGEAHLYWDGSSHHPSPSEGGHVDFAPCNDLQARLLSYLLSRFKHVSYERILSGTGLYNIYCFLKNTNRGSEPGWLAKQLCHGDPAALISEAAMTGRSELCERSLDLFVEIYGAQAGNIALATVATGGIYIGGGIAPKIIRKMKEGAFMKSFLAKGRFSEMLSKIPVQVILNDKAALLGAGLYAAQLMRQGDRHGR